MGGSSSMAVLFPGRGPHRRETTNFERDLTRAVGYRARRWFSLQLAPEPCVGGVPVLRASEKPSAVVVSLSGEIDRVTAEAIDEAARSALEGGASRLEIDLRDVTFMDSEGLHALLDAERSLRCEGVGLALSGAPPCVRRLLELSGTAAMFTVG